MAAVTLFIYFVIFNLYIQKYIKQYPFVETSLHFHHGSLAHWDADPSRELNSVLPFNRPAHYKLGYATPLIKVRKGAARKKIVGCNIKVTFDETNRIGRHGICEYETARKKGVVWEEVLLPPPQTIF